MRSRSSVGLQFALIICVILSCTVMGLAQPRNGEHKGFTQSGKPLEFGKYKRGKKIGEWLQYDTTSGHVIRKTTFVKGVRQGPELVYNNTNGRIRAANWYKNDTLHGMRYVYTTVGILDSIQQYRNGRKNGLQRVYGKEERIALKKIQLVRNDTIIYERRYDYGGELQAIEYYKNGLLDGECRYYTTHYYGIDTTATRICNYKSGKKVGEEREYRGKGVLSSITTWNEGVKHGKSLSYYNDGLKYKEVNFVDGKKNGE